MTLDANGPDGSADIDIREDSAPSNREKLRRCLGCGEEFLSAWAGERICRKCRSSARWRQG